MNKRKIAELLVVTGAIIGGTSAAGHIQPQKTTESNQVLLVNKTEAKGTINVVMMDDANNMTIGNPITETGVIGTADNITPTIPVGYKLESITYNG